VDVFILGDADRVREHIERALLNGNFESASSFSKSLMNALATLVGEIERIPGSSTILAGGDDVCFRLPEAKYDAKALALISQRFFAASSCNISFGVGRSIEAAYLNLRRAKALGGGQIVADEALR
jgi:hypothetical protein